MCSHAFKKIIKILAKEGDFDKGDYEEICILIPELSEKERNLECIKIIENGNPEKMIGLLEIANIFLFEDDELEETLNKILYPEDKEKSGWFLEALEEGDLDVIDIYEEV